MRMYQLTVAVALCGLLVVGCSPGGKDRGPAIDMAAGLAQAKAARAEFDTAWERLRDVRDELEVLKKKARPSAEDTARLSELESLVKEAQQAYDEAFTADDSALTGFLNEALNNLPNHPATAEGLRLYADKAMRNAGDFMKVSGDYRRAIEILDAAASYYEAINLPVPEDLVAYRQHARDMRFITQERFDQIKRNMTMDEVKAITGTPFFPNVREHETQGRKVITWFFNREDGEVAALHFLAGKVYNTTWRVERQR